MLFFIKDIANGTTHPRVELNLQKNLFRTRGIESKRKRDKQMHLDLVQ